MRHPHLTPRARTLRRNMTDAERRLWSRLRANQLAGHRFRRQHPLGPYIVDFACIESRLVVELDGGQHLDSPADARRDAWLRQHGFHVLRFWNDDALLRTDAVLEHILRTVGHAP
ncbi:endonuclease domain-containing protein [Coralloluteibacterium stylophorae]|uniref:Endonuclease domain-containing protein n=1 Tax=Coralloluteibacterium stylophorae TaxID=1776034 RepID=A0A8J7VWG7_9GAMM|nr:endonuclease domain-containing protein [Coralloluteibacterium stylophorae]MBS7459040.1 endonuclease domain-containing protein [Coralloluteibacterium stylophorae]